VDPLGGVGTIAFEAALQGRSAVSNDLSPFASTIAAAKLDPPSREEAEAALMWLASELPTVQLDATDEAAAEFGLNARVADYYHPATLEEVLRARRLFIQYGRGNRGRTFVWASLLHVLHGNRPYALSRLSHPITPFNPRGKVEYRGLIDRVRGRLDRALVEEFPAAFRPGTAHQGDFRDLPGLYPAAFDAVITSPPFMGMRFDRPNWLRLWFCGWEATDFHQTSRDFVERQQTQSLDCYGDLFVVIRKLLRPTGIAVIHMGSGDRDHLVEELRVIGQQSLRLIGEVVEKVDGGERHGIRDKGRTTSHHFLFFEP